MKDILKVMRFDYLCAKPMAQGAYIVIAVMCFLMSLFFSPAICGFFIFGAMIFVIPLQDIASRSDFNKLYGILPVERKNITRARFMFIFFMHFGTELLMIILGLIAYSLKLYRILPNQNSELMQMVSNAFHDLFMVCITIVGMFVVICLIFSYMEMMGQLFGRENELKIIMLTLGIITAVSIAFFLLSNHGIIPMLKLPSLPETTSGRVILGVVINAVMFGLCVLFGEITASQLSKREL